MKKVICVNPGACPMCMPPLITDYVRGRAYTVTAEKTMGAMHGYKLAELPLPFNWWHCSPHFEEVKAADENIFTLASRAKRTRVQEKEGVE